MNSVASILIPCHNAAPWIGETLESALAQTWPECEIIVVDDGSSDESLGIARRFESRGVRVISQPNRGASAARNAALSLATGEYIQFLDADDLLGPEKIEKQIRRLRSAPPDCLASAEWYRFYSSPKAALIRAEPACRDFPDPTELIVLLLHEGRMMHPAAWLVPRSLIEKAGPWNEKLSLNDDGEYFCRIALAAKEIVFVPGARAYYRSGLPGSLSRRRHAAALHSLIESVRLNESHLLARRDETASHRALAEAWQRVAFDVYPELPEESSRAEERAHRFGNPSRTLPGGRWTRISCRLLGWRLTRRLKRWKSPRRS